MESGLDYFGKRAILRNRNHGMKNFRRKFWAEWVRPLILPFVLISAAKSAFADFEYVPTGSMKPTILEGDVVLVNKLAYDLKVPFTTAHLAQWKDPSPGDVVVCFEPGDGTRLVKRVVALPGDTVELRQERLIVNGRPMAYGPLAADQVRDLDPAERARAVFASEAMPGRTHSVMALPGIPALRTFGPVRVPAGSYFVMGDNRDNSKDSRYFGFVPRREIVGRAETVLLSGDLGHYLRPRFDRFFSRLR
jgi:signal peptidase I